MSNPHYDEAKTNIQATDGMRLDKAAYLVAVAQTEALLAIAHELKTANLLSVLDLPTGNISDWTPEMIDDYTKRTDEIATRLGHGETK